MLEVIRKWGVEKRWVFGSVLGVVIVAFVGTMGWMGSEAPLGMYAAKVNDEEILLVEYEQAYESAYKRVRNIYGEQFSDELLETLGLKERVLIDLVNQRLWRQMATREGLVVSDDEVRQAILNMDAFRVNNRFDSSRYHQLLRFQHMSAEAFESRLRKDMMAEKARDLIRAAAQITDADLVPFAKEDAELEPAERAERQRTRREGLLRRKRAQLLAAYTDYLRGQAQVKVYREVVGL